MRLDRPAATLAASNDSIENSMNVLVTGGRGFIGAALTRELIKLANRVRILDDSSTGAQHLPKEVDVIHGDVRDPQAVADACEGVETIYHLAALGSVSRSMADARPTNAVNVAGTVNLLEASSRSGCRRVVFASSSSVYGDVASARRHEDMPTLPISPYGVSKLAAEHYCRVWAALDRIEVVVLRYFNVFGPGQMRRGEYSAVFPAFIDALTTGRQPTIYGDGFQTRSFTFVRDVVDATIAAGALAKTPATLNIAASIPKTVREVLQAIAAVLGASYDPLYLPPRPGDIRNAEADVTAAKEYSRVGSSLRLAPGSSRNCGMVCSKWAERQ